MTTSVSKTTTFSPADDYRKSLEDREKEIRAGTKRVQRAWESYQPSEDPDAKTLSPGKFLATGEAEETAIYLGPHFKRLKSCREQNVTSSDGTLLSILEKGFQRILKQAREKFRKDKYRMSKECYRRMLIDPEMKEALHHVLKDHLSVRIGVFRNQCHLLKNTGLKGLKFFVERTQYQVGAGKTLSHKVAKGASGDWKIRTEGAHPAIIRQLCDNRHILENMDRYTTLIKKMDPNDTNLLLPFTDSPLENLLSALGKDGVSNQYLRSLRTFIFKKSPRIFEHYIEELVKHCAHEKTEDQKNHFTQRLSFYVKKHSEYTHLKATDESRQDWVYRTRLDDLDKGMKEYLVNARICDENDDAMQERILGMALSGSLAGSLAERKDSPETFDREDFYSSIIEFLRTEIPTVHDTFPAGSIMLHDMAQTRVVLPYINHKVDDPFDKSDKEAVRLLNLVATGEMSPDAAVMALKEYSLMRVSRVVERLKASKTALKDTSNLLREVKQIIDSETGSLDPLFRSNEELHQSVNAFIEIFDRDESECLMSNLAERILARRDLQQGEIHFSPLSVREIRKIDPRLSFLKKEEKNDDEIVRIRYLEELERNPKELLEWFFNSVQEMEEEEAREQYFTFLNCVQWMAEGTLPIKKEGTDIFEIMASLEAFEIVQKEMDFDECSLEKQGPVNPAIAEVFANVIAKDADGLEIGRY